MKGPGEMIPTDAFSVDYEVRGFDCGYGGPFSALSLANYFQEAAGLHATRLGIGMAELSAAGRTWMLSRIDVRVDGLPREGDRVRVLTWPSGCERLFALRDIVLQASDGSPLVRAVYAYLVVDAVARKPLRPERALAGGPLGKAAHSVADPRLGAAAAEAADPVCELVARPRHIDYNGHVNNAHIVNWLVDAAAAPGCGALRELRIDFLSEVLAGDALQAAAGRTASGAAASELRRGGAVVARAELAFGG